MPSCLLPIPSSALAWAIKNYVKNPIECVEHCRKMGSLLQRAEAILFLKIAWFLRLYYSCNSAKMSLFINFFRAHCPLYKGATSRLFLCEFKII